MEQIPDFVAQLSDATEQNNQEITQSPVTVQTIVQILSQIAKISENIPIRQIVIEVCKFKFVQIVCKKWGRKWCKNLACIKYRQYLIIYNNNYIIILIAKRLCKSSQFPLGNIFSHFDASYRIL